MATPGPLGLFPFDSAACAALAGGDTLVSLRAFVRHAFRSSAEQSAIIAILNGELQRPAAGETNERFSLGNPLLFSALLACIDHGKDPHVRSIVNSSGAGAREDGLLLWTTLNNQFGGASTTACLNNEAQFFALRLPNLPASPATAISSLENVVRQINATSDADTPQISTGMHMRRYLHLVRDNSSYGQLNERLSQRITDAAWIAAATPASLGAMIMDYWAEVTTVGHKALPAVINDGVVAAQEAKIERLQQQVALLLAGRGGGHGGSSGGGGSGGGTGDGGNGGTDPPGSRGGICNHYFTHGHCRYKERCVYIHADRSGTGQDVRPGVVAQASAAEVAAARTRNGNLHSRCATSFLGDSCSSPPFSFLVDSGAQHSLVSTSAGLHNLQPHHGQLHGVAGGRTAITAIGDFAAEACDSFGIWRPFDLHSICVAPHGGYTLLSTSAICGAGAEVLFAAGGGSAFISIASTGAVFPLQKDLATGGWVLQLRPRSAALGAGGAAPDASLAPAVATTIAALPTGSSASPAQPRRTGGRLRRADEALLLHRRLGHPGWERLLATAPHLRGHDASTCDCEVCSAGKSTREAIFKGPSTTPLPVAGAALTVDLVGPLPRSLQRGACYAIIITDRATRYRWALPLKQKDDAAPTFDTFLDTEVRPRGYETRSVRCDSGGEFIGAAFYAVCQRRGIRPEPAAARTPSQNSISESSVRVLTAVARCLMLEANAPDAFWAHAMAAAALATNCLPTAAVGLEGTAVPWQRWHGTAPPLDRLRVFGCLAWVNADSRQERRKGDKFGAPSWDAHRRV